MKIAFKNILSRLGLFPTVDTVRRLPEIVRWLNGGCRGIAPPPIKRRVIQSYLRHYQIHNFVETGTHLGDTLAEVAQIPALRAISIELADGYYAAAARRFANYPNVELHHGDSGQLMPEIVAALQAPALFWLDGHYSGGTTAKGAVETPVSDELRAILASPVAGHVILVDDVRHFDGSHDYPHLDAFLAVIRADGRYHAEVSADVLRLTPRALKVARPSPV
jgi:hypothetical protein